MENEKTEIICNCAQITLQEILDTIRAGATSVALLQERTGANSSCGRCSPQVIQIIRDKTI